MPGLRHPSPSTYLPSRNPPLQCPDARAQRSATIATTRQGQPCCCCPARRPRSTVQSHTATSHRGDAVASSTATTKVFMERLDGRKAFLAQLSLPKQPRCPTYACRCGSLASTTCPDLQSMMDKRGPAARVACRAATREPADTTCLSVL